MPELALSIPQPVADARPLVDASPVQSDPRNLSRRRLLASAGTVATATAVAVTASAAAPVGIGDDAQIVLLWHRLAQALAMQKELHDQEAAAVLRLPTWARWDGRDERGIAINQPEWTDAMLVEHAIPAEMGRRPDWKDIKDLNEENVRAVLPRLPSLIDSNLTFAEWEKLADQRHEMPEVIAVKKANALRKAAFDARLDEQDAEEARAGLHALDAEQEKVGELICGIAGDILHATPKSMVGAVIKLRAWMLSTLEWGHRERADADGSEECVLSVLDMLEASLPPKIAAAVPHIEVRKWDRPDAVRKETAHA